MNSELITKCAYLFDILKKGGVLELIMNFSGSGDDGQIEWENVHYSPGMNEINWDAETVFNDYNEKPLRLETLVENITYEITTFYDIDFMNNEGNDGWVSFDVVTGKITTNYIVTARKEEYLYV